MLIAQNRLQATLNAIPDLMFEMDIEGRYHDYHFPVYKQYLKFPGQ